jgi:hypothetical protein
MANPCRLLVILITKVLYIPEFFSRLWRTRERKKILANIEKCRTTFYSKKQRPSSHRKIVVYDPFIEGHHCYYIAIFASWLAGDTTQIVVLSSYPETVQKKLIELGDSTSRITFQKVSQQPSKTKFWMSDPDEEIGSLRLWQLVLDQGRRIFPNSEFHIFLPFLDSFLSAKLPASFLDRFQNVAFSGIYFHPKWCRLAYLDAPPLLRSQKFTSIYVLDKNIIAKFKAETGIFRIYAFLTERII